MYKFKENNQGTLVGKIMDKFNYSHEKFGEGFYTVKLEAERYSEKMDYIPIIVSERLIDVKQDYSGEYVSVKGQIRTYNEEKEGKHKLKIHFWVDEIEFVEDDVDSASSNIVVLEGYVCKNPVYRNTPLGREITDLLLAVNRPYGKSDYIPCICWGRNARFASEFYVGEHVRIKGRFQSREYKKEVDGDKIEKRTAYEVSAQYVDIICDEEQ